MRPFCTLALFVVTALAQYTCVDDYTQGTFADQFDFFTGNDPTNGYVNYVDYETAASTGLYSQTSDNVYIGVDHNNTASGRGRNSVRIASTKSYQHGLIILDLAHMPGGACGTWPAFWLLSTSAEWPNGGEVDIIEGVNDQSYNNMAVHTNAGCTISNTGSMSGQIVTSDCNVDAANQATNQGCSIKATNSDTYGSGFNANGGGVYATEWTSNGISIWYFPRSSIPSDISSGSPKPSTWGTPLSRFAGNCDWDQKVVNQQIIFDVTFCGDWAGAVFSTDATCSSKAATCQAFVENNPSAFVDTYWSINSLKVYQENAAAATSSVSSVSSISTSAASTVSTRTSVSTTLSGAASQTTTPSVVTTFVTLTTQYSTKTSSSSPSTTVSVASSTTLLSTTYVQPTTTSTPSYTTSSATVSFATSSTTFTISYTTPSTFSIPLTTSQTTFSTITTSYYTTASTTTSYAPSSSSVWQTWTMAVTPSAPLYPPAVTNYGSPNTFFTVTRPWGGAPSGSWGPPGNSGPGGWGGPGGSGGFHGPPRA